MYSLIENQGLEHRSIIKFLDLEGQSPSNIHERMTAVYGNSAPFSNYLKARRYEDRSALDSSIYQCLNGASKDVFTAATQQLPERWRKSISVDGRNFEKEHMYV